MAAKRNNEKMVKYLCEKFSRVNFQDICGRTALIFATRNGNLAIVKILLSFKADPQIKCDARNHEKGGNEAEEYSGVNPYMLANQSQPHLRPYINKAFLLKVFLPMLRDDPKKQEKVWREGYNFFTG